MPEMSIAVDTLALVEKIKESREKARKEHDKKVAEARKGFSAGLRKQRQELLACLRTVEAGEPVGKNNNWRGKTTVDITSVEVYDDEFDSSSWDKDIALLEMSTQPSLKLRIGDRLSRYL